MANTDDQPIRLISPSWIATLVLAGAVGLCVLWLRSGLIGADQWPIRWLDVEGDLARTSASQIRAAAVGEASGGFFAVDLQRVRTAVESLPWVARVEVSRHWPDALHIRVVEHRPVARWNESGLFSDRGDVFEVDGSEGMQGLAQLSGPESRRDEVLETWLDMRKTLNAVGLDIDELKVDDRGAWRVTLDNGLKVVLGREEMQHRLQRYVDVHRALNNDERRPRVVDMRYTNGLAVRWAGDQTGDEVNHG